jgi:hypothetical protein
MKNDLSNVKVGDWIFTIMDGWVKVDGIDDTSPFPISAGDETYMNDGRVVASYACPSAFTEPPECFNAEPKPCEFVKGQRVIVSDYYPDPPPRGQKAYFSHIGDDGMYYCFISGHTEWSSDGYAESWEYCISAEEEE